MDKMKTFNLPPDHKPYIDKYFLRAKEILVKENLNPIVKAQVFIRKGNCNVYGINEAIAILTNYSDIEKTGKVYALKEGSFFVPKETLMTIEAPIQSIIDLETMYLGVLSAETTILNDNKDINLSKISVNMSKVVDLIHPRPVSYFGARHWRYDQDFNIASTCAVAGATNCSTDEGAKAFNTPFDKGIGTIPHALEAIYHWKDGLHNAVKNSTIAFDKYINPNVPRIALVDYANKEISDSYLTALFLRDKLYGIRIDTCGENFMEKAPHIKSKEHPSKYWLNSGVAILGVAKVAKTLRKNFPHIKIILSSGFGVMNKVEAFVEAEKYFGIKLFDGLGVGGLFHSRMATMDIIEVEGQEIHKVGRIPKPNKELIRVV